MKRTKSSFSFLLAAGLAAGATHAIVLEDVAFAQSNTSGEVRGIIKDTSNGEAVIGATVVIKGPALQGQQAEITDENGSYVISSLPPGEYVITVFYNEAQFDRPNVLIQVGKQAVVNVAINTAEAAGGETIIVEGHAPIVDQGSTKTGVTINSEYTNNIPVGRTFGAVLGAAAGSQGDTYGQGFSGSQSVESTYIIEGLNTTNTAVGGLSSNLPNEFIEETEVITGGYNAEFGRSTGGVINVVTKQGGNEFHGSVFGYFTPGALVAESDPILSEGSAIDTQTTLDYSTDFGAELGGPIIKDKVWFHVGINPSRSHSTVDRIVNTLQDLDGDGNADVDPDTGFTIANEVARKSLPINAHTTFFTAKLSGVITEDHQWQVSAWGNPRAGETAVASLSTAPSRERIGFEDGNYDASLKWTSKFMDGKTQVDLVAGYHSGYDNDVPLNDVQNGSRLRYEYERSLTDFDRFEFGGTPAECMDPDPDTGFINCPVVNYSVGGLGFTQLKKTDRKSLALSATQRVKAGGYHTFKVGVDGDFMGYDADRGYTNTVFYRQSTTRTWTRETYLHVDENGMVPCGNGGPDDPDLDGDGLPDIACSETPRLVANTDSSSLAAYARDSWQVRPNLTINAGLRWEQQTSYVTDFLKGQLSGNLEPFPDVAFKLENMFAPRLGVIYDPTQEGRAKLMAHWGRFYETVPMDIQVRSYGSEIFHRETARTRSGAAGGPQCPEAEFATNAADVEACFGPDDDFVDRGLVGSLSTSYFVPGTKGQYLDELVLGGEYELMADFKIGVNYIHRTLPNVIEDMSADNANYYVIGNPGRDYSDEAASLQAESDRLASENNCDDVDPANDGDLCGLAGEFATRAFNVGRISKFDKPIRTYDGLQLTANQRFSKNALMIASYTYSRELGNYPGLFSVETDQLDPNANSIYDLPGLMVNLYGPMGIDRPHNFKLDGFYQFDLKDAGYVILGGSLRAQSGIPQNTLAAHFVYGEDESYVLPRGAVDRLPMTWQADVKASYGRKIGKNMKLEGFFDVFNLTNNQAETQREETYTLDSMNPIVGGDPEDVRHGKALNPDDGTETGTTPIQLKNFAGVTAHQAPLSMRFGLRLTF